MNNNNHTSSLTFISHTIGQKHLNSAQRCESEYCVSIIAL